MWFAMLVLGALAGAGMGGGSGAILGAICGGLTGWAITQKRQSEDNERLGAIERSVAALGARVVAIERRLAQHAPRAVDETGAVAPAAGDVPPAGSAPAASQAPTVRPGAAAAAPVPPQVPAEIAASVSPDDFLAATLAERIRKDPRAPVPASPAPDPQPPGHGLVAHFVGIALGAFVGSLAGELGIFAGALLGWLVVIAVQSQNARAARDRAPAAAVPSKAQDAVPAPAPPPPDLAPLTAEAAAAQHAADSAEPAVELEPSFSEAAQEQHAAGSAEPPFELEPSFFQRLVGGNIVAKIGVLILFIGVGFLLKYAYDQGRLPVELRLAGVALTAAGMLYGAWRLLERRRLYALILQGCGIGLLYLDVYFALRVYGFVDPTTGFTAFMLLGIASTLLAVRQDAKVLAVLGLIGAFLAPILTGSPSGNHVMLFSYYTLLNAFILSISWFKAWRDLNLVGFLFTFAVGALWGSNNYRPELFGTVEPFVLIFFAMYLVIPILFAQRQPPELKGLVDGTLVFGTPMCAAFMQAGLVRDMPHGLAWSAGIAASLYATLAVTTLRREGMRLLGETYVALAVVFVTLAIFFAFDAYPTFALWTLEGAAIVWVGMRQGRKLARLFGLALQLAGTVYFLGEYSSYRLANPWWNEFVLGCAIIGAAGFIIAWLMHVYRERRSELDPSDSVMLVWAAAWCSIAAIHALYHAYPWSSLPTALLAYTFGMIAVFEAFGARLRWNALRELTRMHLPALVLIALMIALGDRGELLQFGRPLRNGGYWAWPLNLLLFFWIYARQRRDALIAKDDGSYRLAWLMTGVIATWDAAWLLNHRLYVETMAWGAAGIVAACVRFRFRERGEAHALPVGLPVLLWALTFWFVSGLSWINRDFEAAKPAVMLAFLALSCGAFEVAGAFVQWTTLRRMAALLVPALLLAFLLQLSRGSHPFGDYGWLAWPLAIALLYYVLRRQEREEIAAFGVVQHVGVLWLGLAVLTWEGAWQLEAQGFGPAWVTAAYVLLPAAAVAGISSVRVRTSWPFGVHYESIYRDVAIGVISVYLAGWILYANAFTPGGMQPAIYLPLLNPLDIACGVALAATWRWSQTLEISDEQSRKAVLGAFSVAVFLCVNCVMLRTIHYWGGVDYDLAALSRSVLVQSGFSLLWTATALVLMMYATREKSRQLWAVGAVLLGVVVVKLFLNDLSNTGTIARIVSFIGVGAGLMAIGYVAPVPPGEVERQAD